MYTLMLQFKCTLYGYYECTSTLYGGTIRSFNVRVLRLLTSRLDYRINLLPSQFLHRDRGSSGQRS
ncbi:hypothetical protein PAAL66ix_26423 [Paenibacillus alvei A6-6i-x]|nr:hypothetical protein PAAL66ix_26423 [Paenibacillus alvei A6-6i-x]